MVLILHLLLLQFSQAPALLGDVWLKRIIHGLLNTLIDLLGFPTDAPKKHPGNSQLLELLIDGEYLLSTEIKIALFSAMVLSITIVGDDLAEIGDS